MKIYNNVLERIYIYGNLHRYITVISKYNGYKVGEIEVEHHKRMYGKSKYGIKRYFTGFIDMLRLKFILSVKNIYLNTIINAFIIIILMILLWHYIYFFVLLYIVFYLWLIYNYNKYYKIIRREKFHENIK